MALQHLKPLNEDWSKGMERYKVALKNGEEIDVKVKEGEGLAKVEQLLKEEELEYHQITKKASRSTLTEKKPGPDGYMTGLSDEDEEDKKDQMKKQAAMDDDDPDAYKEMPGDKEAREKGKVKKSKHTTAYHKKFKENMQKLKTIDQFLTESVDEKKGYDFYLNVGVEEYVHKIVDDPNMSKEEKLKALKDMTNGNDYAKATRDQKKGIKKAIQHVEKLDETIDFTNEGFTSKLNVIRQKAKDAKDFIKKTLADGEFSMFKGNDKFRIFLTDFYQVATESVTEAYIGPFVFNDKMSDDELKDMYDAALDGYANYSKGFQHPKSKYKQAYQEIEKILKKRGVSVDEGTLYGNEVAIYMGEDGETRIEKRGRGYYGYNNEFDFTAKNKRELEQKLSGWGYYLIAGSLDEAVELVHVYKDGELYGTGELVKGKDKKIKGKKHQLIRFDGSTEDYYPAEDVKLVESVNEKKAPFPYNLGYNGRNDHFQYAKEIGMAVKDIEGIRDYHKMAARGGKTAVQDLNSRILITTIGQPEIKDAIIKALKGVDDNIDLKTIKSNYDAPDRERSKHEQDNDMWKWEIQKKEDFHSYKRKYGDAPKQDREFTRDHQMEFIDMLAPYSTTQHQLADIEITSLDSFLQYAADHVSPANLKKVTKRIKKEYPKLESVVYEKTSMEDIENIARKTKNVASFLSKFFKEFGAHVDKTKDTVNWLKQTYDMVSQGKLDEGVMGDLHQMANEIGDEDKFVKAFFSEYGDKIKKSKDSEEWVRSLYKDTVQESLNEISNKNAEKYSQPLRKLKNPKKIRNIAAGTGKYNDMLVWLSHNAKNLDYHLDGQGQLHVNGEDYEMVRTELNEKNKGLWHNIRAKRKRGEKPARKGSKAYKKAKAAADKLNNEELTHLKTLENFVTERVMRNTKYTKTLTKIFRKEFEDFPFEYYQDGPKIVISAEGYNPDGTLFDMKDDWKEKIIRAVRKLKPKWHTSPNMGGGITIHVDASIDPIDEAKHSVIHKAAKKGNYPVTVIATRDGKVVRQETVDTPTQVPAVFNVVQFEERGQGGDVKVHIESRTGETLFTESVNEGKMPDRYVGLDDIVYVKVKEDSRGANYRLYWRGHDVEAGGRRFGSEKELKAFASDYILSNQVYNKLKYEKPKAIPEKEEIDMEKLKTLQGFVTEKKKQTNDQSPLSDDGMETGIKNKAKESGVPVGLLRIIMRRGLAAWKTGHRPGATQAQWGYARVNSFLTKQDGTWGGADKDIAKKVRDGGHDKKL